MIGWKILIQLKIKIKIDNGILSKKWILVTISIINTWILVKWTFDKFTTLLLFEYMFIYKNVIIFYINSTFFFLKITYFL